MEHPYTILLTFSTETKFCNLNSGKSTLAIRMFLCDLQSPLTGLLTISTVQQILNRIWMDITNQHQQDQDST